jgi:tetratricopeptide (TPR) repeat protein
VNYEVIVVDGGSTDGTKEFLSAQPDNVKVIFDEKLEGAVKAFNKGLRAAQGEYVCWLNDDILVIENALDEMFNFLKDERHAKIGMGAFYYTIMDKDGRCSHNFIINDVAGIPYADQGMLRTSLMKEMGYFDESFFKYSFDPDFSMRVWERGLAVVGCKKAKFIHYQVLDETRNLFPSNGPNSIGTKDGQVFFKKWEGKLEAIRTLIKNEFWSLLTRDQKCNFFHAEGAEFEKEKRYKEAERMYLKALLFAEKIEVLCRLESLYYKQKRFKEAEELYLKTLDAYDDTRVEFLYNLGSVYQQQKRLKEAERVYLKILEIDDSQIEVLYNLASVYQQSNRTEKAIRVFEKVLQLEGEGRDQYWAGACYHLGCLYKEKGNFSKAKRYFERCLRFNPDHKRAKEYLQELI